MDRKRTRSSLVRAEIINTYTHTHTHPLNAQLFIIISMTFIHSINNVIHTNKSVNPFDSDVYLHGVLNVCDVSFHLYREAQTS